MATPEDRSDLFSVHETGPPSLDPVSQVLLPPAERRKQRIRRILAAAGVLLLLALTAWTVRHFWHRSSVESSAERAGATGRPADVQNALDTLDGGELLGLRARLVAMLALSGEGELEAAKAAYAAVPEDDAHEASERLKAEVYIALAEGRAADALEAANRLIPAGDFAAETAHAKSLAQLANGLDAVAAAADAVQHEDGPRYRAQHAAALAATDDIDGALEAIEGAEGPSATLARARALHRGHREGAGAAAEEVLAAESATRAEKAWAEAVLAAQFARAGKRTETREHAASALEIAPPGDTGLRYAVADALTTVGAFGTATEALDGIAAGAPSSDLSQRGRVLAALALSRGQANEALEHLSTVAASPEALLLVGDARRRADQLDAARASYDRAAESSAHAGLAHAARTRLELADGEPEAALSHARLALEAAPTHPRVVPAVVTALLANGDAAEAMRVADAALEAHPTDVRVLAAKADVLLAGESWEEALAVLRRAVERDDSDAELQAELGDAARGAGEFDESEAAYRKALELESGHPAALRGLFQLQVATGALTDAATTWETLDEADVEVDTDTALARVRYLVDSGGGAKAMRELGQLSRRRDLRRDAFVRFAMAENFLQQGNYNRAFAMFGRARVLDGDKVDAYLGQALAQVFAGRMNRATDALRSAAEASVPSDAPEGTEPPAYALPRYLVARGWVEANLGRFPSAGTYADRALEAEPGNTAAHVLRAHVDARSRRDPTEHLRAAIDGRPARPLAMGRLGLKLGPTEEGCALGTRYLEAAPRGELREDIENLLERCEAEE